MARRGPEGKIQDAVIKYARDEHNAYCKKNEKGMYGSAGFLDFSVYPDQRRRKKKVKHFVIEFKKPGEDYTPLQARIAKELQDRGHTVYKIDSITYGKLVIDQECG